jgi:DNA end-binding protein Ku
VRVRKVCEIEDREVSREETVKAYEIDKGTLLAVSGEELREIPLSTAKAIEIAALVPIASIDQLQVGDGYCLQADSQVNARPYKLRSEAVLLSIMDAVLIEHRVWPGDLR